MKYYGYQSTSRAARAKHKLPVTFYTSEPDPEKVPCPFTKDRELFGACVRITPVHALVKCPEEQCCIHGTHLTDADPDEHFKYACHDHKDGEHYHDGMATRVPQAVTCPHCRIALGMDINFVTTPERIPPADEQPTPQPDLSPEGDPVESLEPEPEPQEE